MTFEFSNTASPFRRICDREAKRPKATSVPERGERRQGLECRENCRGFWCCATLARRTIVAGLFWPRELVAERFGAVNHGVHRDVHRFGRWTILAGRWESGHSAEGARVGWVVVFGRRG